MNDRQPAAGFTLIELLIVITIMMALIGLVGGNTLKSIERAEAQTEIASIYSLLKKASAHAFSSGRSVTVRFDKSQVQVTRESMGVTKKQFDHLWFEDQAITFNRSGFPDVFAVELLARGVKRDLSLDFAVSNPVNDKSDAREKF